MQCQKKEEEGKRLTHSVEVLLTGDVNGGALVNEEGGSGSVGVVGWEGDSDTNRVLSLFHQHRAAPLGGIHLHTHRERHLPTLYPHIHTPVK